MSVRLREAGRVAQRFALAAPVRHVEAFGNGLINDTFLVHTSAGGWILQRINGAVFPHPERIMRNLAVLSGHLRRHQDVGLCVPALVRAADGEAFVRADDGAVWRLMAFVANSRVLERIDDEAQASEVGRALGTFHRLLDDLPPDALAVTLPGFHVAPAYLEAFTAALARHTGACRTSQMQEALDFVDARRRQVEVLEAARRALLIRERVIHGDPKLANILFDSDGTRVLGLIDLDTVQPGLIHYDVADCLRSCCSRGGESAGVECGRIFDLALCRAILAAYARPMRGLLTPSEVRLLYEAVHLIPFELGLRFLTDHLEGDRYFRVTRPGENLLKARTQFALVADIEGKEAQIRAIIADCFNSTEEGNT